VNERGRMVFAGPLGLDVIVIIDYWRTVECNIYTEVLRRLLLNSCDRATADSGNEEQAALFWRGAGYPELCLADELSIL